MRLKVPSFSSTLSFLHFPGRFDEAVIEERRNATEAMFLFTTTIPALYNSPQLKDFFRVRLTRMWKVKQILSSRQNIWPGQNPQCFPPSLFSGWRSHKASGGHSSVLCRASASPSHPPPKAEGLGLWTSRGGGGKGGSHLTPGPGHQPGLRSGRTGGGGRGLQRDGRLSERRARRRGD